MKIAIFGIGAIGGYIAGRLTNAGEEVSLISRGETLNVIRNSGLTIHNENNNYTVTPKHITDNPEEIGIVDTIIICVKADAVEIASKMIKPLGSHTCRTVSGRSNCVSSSCSCCS